METKICKKCQQPKSIDDFGKDKNSKDGKNQYCILCSAEKSRDWSRNNKEKVKVWNKEYRQKNHQKHLEDSRQHYQNNKKQYALNSLKNRYGVTEEQFQKMLSVEKCPICGNDAIHEYEGRGCKSGKIVVDHEHNTGKIRGFICADCNKMLGHSKDNTQILQNAIKYLETHSVAG